jgi:sporulation protein YlmC with PRC-barrel domain
MTTKKIEIHQHDSERVPTFSRLRDIDKTIVRSDEDIRGRMVKDNDGYDLGMIDSLLVDDIEGKVRFMVVASGGVLGIGESKSVIPVDAITRVTSDEVFISHTREHVAGAPLYDPEVITADPNYLVNVYRHYGYGGYFRESGGDVYPRPRSRPSDPRSGG